jgi:HK97 family phage portal protein
LEGGEVSLFFTKPAVEQRSVSVPWSGGGDSPLAPSSIEAQLGVIPAYAAIRLVSDAISSLPLQAFRKVGDGRQSVPLPSIFDGSAEGTRIDWLSRAVVSLLARGNAIGYKTGGSLADASYNQITWLHPDRVIAKGTVGDPHWFYQGREIPRGQILHIPAIVLPEQILGVSPMTACRSAIETGVATQKFTKEWFQGRAIPGIKMKNTFKKLDIPEATATRDRLKASLRNGEPFVHGSDWELDIISLPADDAGFIAASRLTATQIATIYGVPPEMIGGETGASMTYSTTEQQQIQFLTYSLRPWLVRLEAAFSSLLPKDQYVKFNADALIRVDTKGRYDVHRIAREIGMKNINEIRALEDEQPLPDDQGTDYAPLGAPKTNEARGIAEMIQKIYLGVGKVITADEAREIINAGGAELSPNYTPAPGPAPTKETS